MKKISFVVRRVLFAYVFINVFILKDVWAQTDASTLTNKDVKKNNVENSASSNKNADSSAKVQEFILKNGMTLWVKQDHRAPTAVHMLWVRVGAMDEVDGTTGVAHMLEHMLFKGTPTVPAGEFSKRVAALGGRENAFTAQDMTAYFQQIPVHNLEAVMQLEADRFANNHWSDEEFKKEMQVVQEERRLRTEDVARAKLVEELNAAMYVASPYRRPIVGWMSDLESMTAQDARDFFKKWYAPQNAAIIVVGDVDPQAVLKLAQKYYEPINNAQTLPERKPRTEPQQKGLKQLIVHDKVKQPYISLAFKVAGFSTVEDSQDAYALSVLSAVLDGHTGARLNKELTQNQGKKPRLANSVGSYYTFWGRGPQNFYLEGEPAQGVSTQALQKALLGQIQKIAKEGVSEAELNRVKVQLIAGQVYQRDSMMYSARELGVAWILKQTPQVYEKITQKLQQINSSHIQSVANKYFKEDNLTIATLAPREEKTEATATESKK